LLWNGVDPAGAATAVVGAHPVAGSTTFDRIRVFCRWDGSSSEPRETSPDPHLLYLYVLCDRGPPTS